MTAQEHTGHRPYDASTHARTHIRVPGPPGVPVLRRSMRFYDLEDCASRRRGCGHAPAGFVHSVLHADGFAQRAGFDREHVGRAVGCVTR